MKSPRIILNAMLIIILAGVCYADFNVDTYIKYFDKFKDQLPLTGSVTDISIDNGPLSISLDKGTMGIYDFGTSLSAVMIYNGDGEIAYNVPDELEQAQLKKYFGEIPALIPIKELVIYQVRDWSSLINISSLTENKADKSIKKAFKNSLKLIDRYSEINICNRLLPSLISGKPDDFMAAYIVGSNDEELLFLQNVYPDDYYALCCPATIDKDKYLKVISGYTPKGQDYKSSNYIDIISGILDGKIDKLGKIKANYKLEFKANSDTLRYLQLKLSDHLKIKSVTDARDVSLPFWQFSDQIELGISLAEPVPPGKSSIVVVEYEGKPFHQEWEVYYNEPGQPWYPVNLISDRTGYEVTLEYPESYNLALGGQKVMPTDITITVIHEIYDSDVTELNIGVGKLLATVSKINDIPIVIYTPKQTDWAVGFYLRGETSTANIISDLINITGSRVWINDTHKTTDYCITFFQQMTGYYPYDILMLLETPFIQDIGSPGLVNLSSTSYQRNTLIRHRDEIVRAQEIVNQWWGNSIYADSYRDDWLIEGFSAYSGLLAMCNNDPENYNLDSILSDWSDTIYTHQSNAIPIVIGDRLRQVEPESYQINVIKKSAMILNMIRIMFYDFKLERDTNFISFIKEISNTYRNSSITTAQFKEILNKYMRMDMSWFLDQWIYDTQIPSYDFSYTVEKSEEKYLVNCQITRANVPENFRAMVVISVQTINGRWLKVPIWLDQPEFNMPLPPCNSEPDKVEFNMNNAVLCKVINK